MKEGNDMQCREIQDLIVLYVCDELDSAEAARVEGHTANCPECDAALDVERRLHQAVLALRAEEPSPAFLAECRMELSEALEQAGERGFWRRLVAGFTPMAGAYRNWAAAHPAMGAAVFILLGVTVGNLVPRMMELTSPGALPAPQQPGVTVAANEPVATRGVRVTGINLIPASTGSGLPSVEVQTMAETPQVLRGTVDDPNIRRFLVGTMQDPLYSAGARLKSIELLKPQGNDGEVRGALCKVARTDANPGVRLKALEALRGYESADDVQLMLLDLLLNDSNSGVRVEAINALTAVVQAEGAQPDARVMKVLRERMEKDPNTYVRLQSAAAVRQLAQRGVY